MVVYTLERLGPIAAPADYHYLGLGALEFTDFELVQPPARDHHDDKHRAGRYTPGVTSGTVPYNGIRVLPGQAVDQLANVKWSDLNAAWLDFEDPLNTNEVLQSVRYLAGRLSDGDFLAGILNAEPGSLKDRLARSTANVGAALVPANTGDGTLGGWGWADRQQQVLYNVLRNELRRGGRNRLWRQVLNIQYRDVARVQIVAGIIGCSGCCQSGSAAVLEQLAHVVAGRE